MTRGSDKKKKTAPSPPKLKAKLELGKSLWPKHPNGQKMEPARIKALEVFMKNGVTNSRIARALNVSARGVRSWRARFKAGEALQQRKKPGRPRSVNTQKLQALMNKMYAAALNKRENNTMATFRANVAKSAKKALRITLTTGTFKRAMRACGLTSKSGIKKPELMIFKAKERLNAARKRLKWTQKFIDGIVWIDQACAMRDHVGHFIVKYGEAAPFTPTCDGKGEKVHFMIGMSTVYQGPFEALDVRQPVLKDGDGRTVPRTIANGTRRKFDPNDPGKNKPFGKANNGETWTSKRVIDILMSKRWLPFLKNATGVVLDAQASFHKPVIAALRSKGVNVIDHPAGSPDFNVIEQVNAAVKRGTEAVVKSKNNVELLEALEANYAEYTCEEFKRHTATYKNTMRACVANNGGPTKY